MHSASRAGLAPARFGGPHEPGASLSTPDVRPASTGAGAERPGVGGARPGALPACPRPPRRWLTKGYRAPGPPDGPGPAARRGTNPIRGPRRGTNPIPGASTGAGAGPARAPRGPRVAAPNEPELRAWGAWIKKEAPSGGVARGDAAGRPGAERTQSRPGPGQAERPAAGSASPGFPERTQNRRGRPRVSPNEPEGAPAGRADGSEGAHPIPEARGANLGGRGGTPGDRQRHPRAGGAARRLAGGAGGG